MHVTLPGHTLMLALKNSNALLNIELGKDKHLAIPKQVQRDPLKGFLEHVDLLIVKRGEKVVVDVPLNVTGDAAPESLVGVENTTISVEVDATAIPSEIEVSIEGLEVGSQLLAKDLQLPKGSTLAVDEDLLIINVTAAPTAAEVDAELSEAEAEAGIEKDEPESEDGDAAEADAEAGDAESE